MKSEFQIQAEIIVWFRNNYTRANRGVIFSVPNEATYQNKNFKTSGTLIGVSDLIVILKGVILFVEVKNEANKQSYAQLQFEQTITDLGFKYILVRSLGEFCDVLNQFE